MRGAALVVLSMLAGLLVWTPAATAEALDPEATPVDTSLELVEATALDDDSLQSMALSLNVALTETRAARIELEADTAVIGVTWELNSAGPQEVQWRSLENGVWSAWRTLDHAHPNDRAERAGTDPITVANVEAVDIRVTVGNAEVPGLAVHVVQSQAFDTPTNTLAADGGGPVSTMPTLVSAATSAPQLATGFQGLAITTRGSWCAQIAECNQSAWEPEPATFKGAVVHHTAGTNNYTQEQVPQQIRNVWNYHAKTLGWDDIGYNLIVDKFGGVWEGRAGGLLNQVAGAHAYKSNFDTFGVAILGDFQVTPPPAVAREQLAKVIAFKLAAHGISSASETITIRSDRSDTLQVPTVSAHRDVGFTECPGAAFYSQMGQVRTAVQKYLDIATGNPTPVYRFWSPVSGSHFYTTDVAERDHVRKTWPREWSYEGERFTAFSTEATHAVPVYRFWSPRYHAHFYTADPAEKADVERRWPDVWHYEKVAFYAYPADFTPVNSADVETIYRFWGPYSHSHFYTSSATERDHVRKTWPREWSYEGERFKVPAG